GRRGRPAAGNGVGRFQDRGVRRETLFARRCLFASDQGTGAMTSAEINEALPAAESPTQRESWLKRWDAFLEWGSEYLNPILVKETRQALKSKQFAITFTLVLLAGWVWSLVAIIMRSPGIAYAPDG